MSDLTNEELVDLETANQFICALTREMLRNMSKEELIHLVGSMNFEIYVSNTINVGEFKTIEEFMQGFQRKTINTYPHLETASVKRVYVYCYESWYSFTRKQFIDFLNASPDAPMTLYGKDIWNIPKRVEHDWDENGKPCDYYSLDETVIVYNVTNFQKLEDWFDIYKEWGVPIPESNGEDDDKM